MGRVSTAIIRVSAVLVAAFFQSFAGAPPAAPTEGPSPSSQAVRPRLAVLDFRVEGKVDATGSSLVAAVVREEFNRSGRFDLMDREMMRERMTEKDFAASDECDQVRCLVKFGKTLDVQQIVGGQVASFGQTWVLTMRLVDVNTGREEKTVTRRHDGAMEDLLDVARDAAQEMLGDAAAGVPSERRRSNARDGNSPRTLTLDCGGGVTTELVLIPAGKFLMGSLDSEPQRDDDEGPQHRVTISRPFYMGKFEVTQAQWQAVMGSNPSCFKGDGDLPVERVSWNDCVEFCRKLASKTGRTVRLPSEAEWEYACRAGTTTPFHFGRTISTDQANYDWNYTYGTGVKGAWQVTTPVGSFPASAWGLHDMHGNVWEWCEDVYHDSYAGAPTDGSAWTSGGNQDDRLLRGGGWYGNPWFCRSANRVRYRSDDRYGLSGFRVVVVASGTP